jgi:hypothetical protein
MYMSDVTTFHKNDRPVRIWRRLRVIPVFRVGELLVVAALGLRLVVNRIEADDTLQKGVQLRVGRRFLRDFEQGSENVYPDLEFWFLTLYPPR